MSILLQRSVQYAFITLVSALMVCVLFVMQAPTTSSEPFAGGAHMQDPADMTQSYTVGAVTSLPSMTYDGYGLQVPNYANLRTAAIAYAHTQLDAAYKQADLLFPNQQSAHVKTLQTNLKQATTASAKSTIAKALSTAQNTQLPSVQQWTCLNNLWTGESDWNLYAVNAKSGAYGIAQALPANKMATTGSDWQDSYKTQITWGLQYITDRYKTPCNAWQQWQQRDPHWY